MPIVIRIIGALAVIMGILFVIKPQLVHQFFNFINQDKRIYIAGVIRFLLGTIFLVGASQCKLMWVIIILGILFLLSGMLVFTLGIDKCKSFISGCLQKSLTTLRLFAVIPIVIGILIIIAA